MVDYYSLLLLLYILYFYISITRRSTLEITYEKLFVTLVLVDSNKLSLAIFFVSLLMTNK